MGRMSSAKRAFTLRFENPRTHELLALVADEMNVSMSALAESMIANQLGSYAAALEQELSDTLAKLAEYRDDPDRDVRAFALAEVSHHDPVFLADHVAARARSTPSG
jgi:hypothetical protein